MDLRRGSLILIFVLIAWIAGASYWYVCKVREDCPCGEAVEVEVATTRAVPDSTYQTQTDPDTLLEPSLSEVKDSVGLKLDWEDVGLIYFAYNSSEPILSSEVQSDLERLASYVQANPGPLY